MQFGVGFASLCFLGAIVMQFIFFAIASVAGGIEQVLNHPQWTAPFLVLLLPLVWGLLAGRAHDIGWPGWPIVALYLAPWPAWMIVMDQAVGLFGGAVATHANGISFYVLEAAVFAPVLLFWLAFIVLAAVPGQRTANPYGAAPAPGLWNDLPPQRA
jgi:uncharacterized membrane protein YhaH (DUF805 family)